MSNADWKVAVTVRYAIRPTLAAMGREAALRGWTFDVAREPNRDCGQGCGPVACALTIPTSIGALEVFGRGATAEEALGRAIVAAPRDPMVPGDGVPAPGRP